MIQMDLFDLDYNEIVGCNLMRQKDWEAGVGNDKEFLRQYKCPLTTEKA